MQKHLETMMKMMIEGSYEWIDKLVSMLEETKMPSLAYMEK